MQVGVSQQRMKFCFQPPAIFQKLSYLIFKYVLILARNLERDTFGKVDLSKQIVLGLEFHWLCLHSSLSEIMEIIFCDGNTC